MSLEMVYVDIQEHGGLLLSSTSKKVYVCVGYCRVPGSDADGVSRQCHQ